MEGLTGIEPALSAWEAGYAWPNSRRIPAHTAPLVVSSSAELWHVMAPSGTTLARMSRPQTGVSGTDPVPPGRVPRAVDKRHESAPTWGYVLASGGHEKGAAPAIYDPGPPQR